MATNSRIGALRDAFRLRGKYRSVPLRSTSNSLTVTKIQFAELEFGEIGDATMTSLRVAPQLVGLGLLEAVPDETLLSIAERQTEQGVSGRPNYVWDVENERRVMGRLGWKANQPSVRQQVAAAFMGDIGATTYLFQQENCPAAQEKCLDTPSAASCGGQGGCGGNAFRPEVNPSRLTNISLYLRTLAVPARRSLDDPQVKQGEKLFSQAQCSTCHIPELKTAPAGQLPHDIAAAADVTIHAYTDMLLHDMGPDLADGRPLPGECDGSSGKCDRGRALARWRSASISGVVPQHDGGRAQGAREVCRIDLDRSRTGHGLRACAEKRDCGQSCVLRRALRMIFPVGVCGSAST